MATPGYAFVRIKSGRNCLTRRRGTTNNRPRPPKHRRQHRIGQLTCGRVLLAGMIRSQQHRLARADSKLLMMPERKGGAAADNPVVAKNRQVSVASDPPEC